MKVAIVILAHNEAATIQSVVTAAAAFGSLIVVDDGSTDHTDQLAGEAGAQIVRHDHHRGYDAALQSGFEKADALGMDIVVTLDADGQHDPNIIANIVAPLESGKADLVIGVRASPPRFMERVFGLHSTTVRCTGHPVWGKGIRHGPISSQRSVRLFWLDRHRIGARLAAPGSPISHGSSAHTAPRGRAQIRRQHASQRAHLVGNGKRVMARPWAPGRRGTVTKLGSRRGKVVAITQARIGSTRLPGKILLQAAGKPLLEHHLGRVARSKLVSQVVVATTTGDDARPILEICDRLGIAYFQGSTDDVLARYAGAATKYTPTWLFA